MSENSKIGWTGHTWKAWHGCTEIAPEHDHCYAAIFDSRGLHSAHTGVASRGEWTGKITPSSETVWQAPFKWRDGLVFTCSMGNMNGGLAAIDRKRLR